MGGSRRLASFRVFLGQRGARGGRVLECLKIVRQLGGTAVAVAVLVDRSAGQAKFDVPCLSLLEMSYPTYPANQVPPELAKLPATKPGS